jgi:hypothetical protein
LSGNERPNRANDPENVFARPAKSLAKPQIFVAETGTT